MWERYLIYRRWNPEGEKQKQNNLYLYDFLGPAAAWNFYESIIFVL